MKSLRWFGLFFSYVACIGAAFAASWNTSPPASAVSGTTITVAFTLTYPAGSSQYMPGFVILWKQSPSGVWTRVWYAAGTPGTSITTSAQTTLDAAGTWTWRATGETNSTVTAPTGTMQLSATTTVVPPNTPPLVAYDGAQAVVYQGRDVNMSGWAADNETGAPVTRVDVFVDGTDVADALLNDDRPDVANAYGRSDYRYSGWHASYNTGGLSAGTHTVFATGWDNMGASATSDSKSFTVARNPTGSIQILDSNKNLLPLDANGRAKISIEGQQFYVRVNGSDPDGNLAQLYVRINKPDGSAFAYPEGASVSGFNASHDFGPFTATAENGAVGVWDVWGHVADSTNTGYEWNGGGWYGLHSPDIQVYQPNRPPQNLTISAPPATIRQGESVTLSSGAVDLDGNLVHHMFYRRGARSADTFAQDWNGWSSWWDSAAGWSNWTNNNPGPATGGASSSITATFTPSQPGFWQFHANALDASGIGGSGATTAAVFVAPLPGATISANTSRASANGGGTLVAYTTDTLSVASTATAAGWLSEHSILAYTGTTSPTNLVGVATGGLSGAAGVTTNSRNGTWTPPAVGTFTLYSEAFTGRSSGERANGTSGYPGYLDAGTNKRITVSVAAPVRNAQLEWWGTHSGGTISFANRVYGPGSYTFNTGNTITLRGFSQDTDGILDTTAVRIEVLSPAGAVVADWTGGEALNAYWSYMDRSYTFPSAVIGNYTVRVTTTMSGATATNSWILPVANRAPVVAMSVSPASIVFGQKTTVSATATDADANLAFHGILALNQAGNDWYRSPSTDHSTGWGNHPTSTDFVSASYTSGVVSGGSSTRSVEHRPSWAGTLTYHSNAHDTLVWSNPSGYASVAVAKATPNATFAARSLNPNTSATYAIVAGDLNARFSNPHSAAVAAPTGTVTYSVVACPSYPAEVGRAITVGSTLTAGAAYTVRASYPGDANYNTTTVDAVCTVLKGTQSAVTSTSSSSTYGNSFTPTAAGGNGSGAYQWELVAGGSASGAVIDSSTGAITTTSIGTVSYHVRRLGETKWNDSAWSPNYTLDVGTRAITVTLSGSKAYNGNTTSTGATASLTTGTLASGDTIAYAYGATSNANVGSYTGLTTATISNATAPTTRTTNYAITYAGSYTITKANQTAVSVSASPSSIYTSTSSTVTASGGSGSGAWTITSSAGGTLTGSGATRAFTAGTASTYTITAQKAGDANYNISPVTSTSIIVAADTTAPTVPAGLSATGIGSTSFTLNWSASTDNVAVTDYEVFSDGTTVGLSGGATSKTILGLVPGNEYKFRVRARDGAGNWSAQSGEFSIELTLPESAAYPGTASSLPAPTSDIAAGGTLVGSTVGSLSVGKSGEATYSIPLWVVPGTSGMEPQLSLNYSSQGGAGPAGFGWSVGGISSITRGPPSRLIDNKIKPVSFSVDDAYYLDGQRLIVVSGTNGADGSEYRTQMESFTRVIAHGQTGSGPAWFEATTKSGLTIVFGDTSVANSRVVDAPQSGGSRGVWSWAATKITDIAGNYMTFSYDWMADAHEQRIAQIDYTGNTTAGLSTFAKVKFIYDSGRRADWRRSFNVGMRFETYSRLSSIECYGPASTTAVKRYVLSYKAKEFTDTALLEKLTEYDINGYSFNPLKFDYSEQTSATLAFEQVSASFPLPAPISCNADRPDMGTGFVDLNGDGWTDFVVNRYTESNQQAYPGAAQGWLGSPTGWQPSSAWVMPWRLNRDDHGDQGARFADVNGDGLVDCIWGMSGGNIPGRGCRLNDKGTGWKDGSAWTPPVDFANDNEEPQGVMLVDVNGDGLVDMLVSRGTIRGVYLNTPTGWDLYFRNTVSNWQVPVAFYDGTTDNGARLVDVNGDGLPDILQARMNKDATGYKNAPQAWLNNGSGWTAAPQFAPTVPLCRENYPLYGTEISDINGDGLPDIICHHWNGDSTQEINETWLNTGSGWYLDAAYQVPYALACARSSTDTTKHRAGSAVIDLNQDGLPDFVWNRHSDVNGNMRGNRIMGPHGFTDWEIAGLNNTAYYLTYDGRKGIGGQFVDFDGDGAPDFIWSHYAAYNNNVPAGCAASGAYRNKSVRPNLLNAVTNGLGVKAEIVYTHLTKRGGDGKYIVYQDDRTASVPSLTNRVGVGPMTVVQAIKNVDGTKKGDGTDSTYEITYRYGGLRSHPLYGSLGFSIVSINDARTGISQDTAYCQTYPFVGMPEYSVTRQGSRTLKDSTIIYAAKPFNGGKTVLPFALNVQENTYDADTGDLLSGTTTVNDSDGTGDTVSVFPPPGTKHLNLNTTAGTYLYAPPTEPGHDDSLAGLWLDDYGNVTQLKVHTHDGAEALVSSVVTVNTYYDTAASLTTWRLGRLARSTVTHSRTGQSSIIRTSAFTYAENNTGMLETETVEPDKGADLKVTTTRTRDGYGNVTGVTTTTTDPITSATVTRSATTGYDPRGRFPLGTKNALGHEETYDYDQNLGLKLSLTGPNGFKTSWEYDGFGRIKKETAPDGTYSTTTHAWDSSGYKYLIHTETRLMAGSAPAVSDAVIAPPSRTYFDTFGRARLAAGLNGDGKLLCVATDYDDQGRAYRTSQPYFSGGTQYWATAEWDTYGRPSKVWTPIDDPAGTGTVLKSLTTYSYAGLHSYTVVKAPVDDSGNATGSFSKSRRKDSWVNALGQTVRVVDNYDLGEANAQYAEVSYSHDAIGNVLTTTVYKENNAFFTTSFEYDLRGRKTQMIDPNMGVWKYEYDALGQLRRQTDAKGKKVTLAYDELGRMKKRTRPEQNSDSSTRDVTTYWVYDSAEYGKGKLHRLYVYTGSGDPVENAAATSDYYRERYAYDLRGRPSSTKRIIYDESSGTDLDPDSPANTRAYTFGYAYDSYGRLDRLTYPFGYQTQNVYSNLGQLKEIRRTDGRGVGSDGQHGSTSPFFNRVLWQAAKVGDRTTDEYGRALAARLGNGIELVWARPTAGGGVTRITATLGGNTIRRFDYTYDGFQNVRTRADRLRDLSGTEQLQEETFGYDKLQRLTSWQIGSQTAKTAAYDAIGNITNKSDVGDYLYDSTYSYVDGNGTTVTVNRPNAVSAAGGQSFTYDSNGNCLSDGQRTIQWTMANQVRKITKGANSAEFYLDASDQRVRQKSNSGTTIYVGGLFERFVATGNTAVEHRFYVITPTGRAVLHTEDGSAANGKDQYFVGDALGSISSVYDHLARHVETRRYDPWGVQTKVIAASGVTPTTRGFTDHEMLEGVGLIHMNGRVYDPVLGRFLSADPFVDDATNAGSYNRYAYCGNDPLGHTDPSGYFSLKGFLEFGMKVPYKVDILYYIVPRQTYNQYAPTVAGIVVGAIVTLATKDSQLGGAAAGFVAGFYGSMLNGGSLGDSFQSGAIGAGSGWAMSYASGAISAASNSIGSYTGSAIAREGFRAVAHGVVGGAIAEIQGGEFRHGFISSAATSAIMHSGPAARIFGSSGDRNPAGIAYRTSVAAVIGGTVSSISGGKFANGAITAAFQHLFNAEGGETPSTIDGKKAHSGFGKSQKVGLGTLADNVTETANTITVDELKPAARLANNSKFDSAINQLYREMAGAAAGAPGKAVTGRLWVWDKLGGAFEYTQVMAIRWAGRANCATNGLGLFHWLSYDIEDAMNASRNGRSFKQEVYIKYRNVPAFDTPFGTIRNPNWNGEL